MAYGMLAELSPAEPVEGIVFSSPLWRGLFLLWNVFSASTKGRGPLILLLTIAFYALCKAADFRFSLKPLQTAFCVLFSFIQISGHSLMKGMHYFGETGLFGSHLQTLKVLCIWFGVFLLYGLAFRLLEEALSFSVSPGGDALPKGKKLSAVLCHIDNHPMCLLLLIWGIHVLIRFPGAMTPDNWGQLTQFNGMFPFFAHWPPFHTWLLGSLVFAGGGSAVTNTIGLFAYVLMQYIFLCFVFARTICVMRKLGVNRAFRLLTLAIYAFSPLFCGYIATVEKDVMYSGCLVLMLCEMLLLGQDEGIKLQDIVLLTLSASLLALFRKNGPYVLIPTAAAALLLSVIQAVKRNRASLSSAAGLLRGFAVPLILVLSFFLARFTETALTAIYDIQPGSFREALSLPAQQIARYVKLHPDRLSEEDRMALGELFDDADDLGGLYDALLADPVKAELPETPDPRFFGVLFSLWGKELADDPFVFLEATLHQNADLFCFDDTNYRYFRDFHMEGEDRLEFIEVSFLQEPQTVFSYGYGALQKLPLLGCFCDIALYVNLSLMLIVLLPAAKRYSLLPVFVPCIVSVMIVIAGPGIYQLTRYAFPIVYGAPLLFACVAASGKAGEACAGMGS